MLDCVASGVLVLLGWCGFAWLLGWVWVLDLRVVAVSMYVEFCVNVVIRPC